MRRWVLFWCLQSYAWVWDAPAAVQQAGHELAPNPYASQLELAPNPYAGTTDRERALVPVNLRSRRAHIAARLAPSPYDVASASLAPMPYAGRMPERELGRPSAQPLALAASPYLRSATPELAADPY